MAAAADLSRDLAELKHLLSQAKRPHVQNLLSKEILSLEKVVSQNQAEPVPIKTFVAPAPETRYLTLSSFSWDQDVEKIKIYLPIAGATSDKVATDFKQRSFELKVHEIEGKNYKFTVPKLNKAILPEKCSVVVKPNKITIIIKKDDKGTWADLHFKEDKLKPKLDDKDPMSGLMQLMKNMYEQGDDEMKKNIAKAYTEAHAGKTPDMANL